MSGVCVHGFVIPTAASGSCLLPQLIVSMICRMRKPINYLGMYRQTQRGGLGRRRRRWWLCGGGDYKKGISFHIIISCETNHKWMSHKRVITSVHLLLLLLLRPMLTPAKLGHIRNGEPPITCPQSISRMIPSFLRRARVGRDHHVSIQRASQSEKCKVLDTLFYGCSPLEISRPPIPSSMTLE